MNKVVIFLLVLWVPLSWARDKIPFTDAHKSIIVTPDATAIVLKIKSNPTTGYSWFLVNYNESLLSPISYKYYPSQPATPHTATLIGAPGYDIWRFRVNTAAFIMPQITTITLQYSRPWAVSPEDPQSKFTIVIQNVKPR